MADDCNANYKDADFAYYRFEPSVAMNTLFMILFILTTILHAVQIWRTRTWYLSALVIGGCCEVVGYAGRIMNAREDPGCWTLGLYVMQNLLILLAPALMAASIYMILGRIILLTNGEHLALIKQRWLTKIFVTGDVISLLTQGCGGGLMASGDNHETGERVIIGGLFVQLAFFGVFVVVAGLFHRQMRSNPTNQALTPAVRWQTYLTTLYVTGVLIWVRSLFRVIEFIQGNDGQLMRSEVYVFVFDGLLMLAVLAWTNWFHPSEIGLLLRGSKPITNGFELLRVGRGGEKRRPYTVESLSSDNDAVVSGQRR
ncbi:RTM1 [Fusarium albosuccineum]|uniref:RTM1 n=1 Tax=Fusarium albosuccineum TaxID=1237068 RepID=A0A8H4LEY3_9HYPO|nr:RTM1 [Fusarium albosuccineum]